MEAAPIRSHRDKENVGFICAFVTTSEILLGNHIPVRIFKMLRPFLKTWSIPSSQRHFRHPNSFTLESLFLKNANKILSNQSLQYSDLEKSLMIIYHEQVFEEIHKTFRDILIWNLELCHLYLYLFKRGPNSCSPPLASLLRKVWHTFYASSWIFFYLITIML